MPEICFLLNLLPDFWVNFFLIPENLNSLFQNELNNSSQCPVQPSHCSPWPWSASCIGYMPFPKQVPPIPAFTPLFCFPSLTVLSCISDCVMSIEPQGNTHTSSPPLIISPVRNDLCLFCTPKGISALPFPFIKSFSKCWLRIYYILALCWSRQGPWSCEGIIWIGGVDFGVPFLFFSLIYLF